MESPRLRAHPLPLRATAITAALLLGSFLLHGPEVAHASPGEEEQQVSLLEHAEGYFQENPPAPPQEEAPDFGPGDRAVSAWDSDEITTDEMVRYGFLTAFDPDELPSEYQPDDDADLDLDLYVPYVLSHMDQASEETQDWLEERTTPQVPESVRGGVLESQEAADDCGDGEVVDDYFFACGASSANFTVLYNIGTGDGLPPEDSDGNGRPDALDTIIDALEEAYSTYSNMGFDHASGGRVTVLLGPAPRGQAFVSPVSFPGTSANPIVMSSDPGQTTTGRNEGRYNYLPRHELFHVFQYHYIADPTAILPSVNWWMEATAEWATREALPSGDGDELYATSVEDFLDHPEEGINASDSLGGGRQYGALVVASYFTEAVSQNFVLDTWRSLASGDEEIYNPMEAIQQVVDFYGRSMNDLLLGFSVANYRLDRPSEGTFFLGAQEGYEIPDARGVWRSQLATGGRPPRATHTLSPGDSQAGLPEIAQGGTSYVELTASESGRLDVNVDAHVGNYRYALMTWGNDGPRPDPEPADMASAASADDPRSSLTVSLAAGETATLVISRTDVHPIEPELPEPDVLVWNAHMRDSGDDTNIMVVGDSITHGNEGAHSWRYVLDHHLRDHGVEADFVGPRTGAYDIHTDIRNRAILDGEEPPPQEFYPGPSTASYYDNRFDRDHNAMWGWTFADANNTIHRDMNAHDPEYLLIALGFNDITWGYSDAAGTVASARTMVEEARAADPEINILISNVVTRTPLPEFEWLNPEIREYGDLLEDEVASLSTSQSPVHLVDISSGFDPVGHAWDGLHPNTEGDYFIGAAFADSLDREFDLGGPYGSLPADPPDVSLTEPDWVRVEVTDQGFHLRWARVFGASGYLVWTRNVTEGEDWRLMPLPVPGDYFHSTWVREGEVHEFRVAAARGDDNVGPVSSTASAEAAPRTLPGPSNVRGQVDGTDVTVTWDEHSDARGYQVFWIEALGNYPVMNNAYVSAGEGEEYTISGLDPGMRYDVAVSSVNEYGAGIPTGTLNEVVIPGNATHGEERPDFGWDADDESLLGTALRWEGYPDGGFPILPEELAQPVESSDGGEDASDRVFVPTAVWRREEGEE